MKINLTLFSKARGTSLIKKKTHAKYMHPVREWTIGLCVAGLLFTAGASFIAYDFHKQFSIFEEVVSVTGQTVTYNEREVTSYAQTYEAKEKAFNALRKHTMYVAPVEPEHNVPQSIEENVEVTPLAEVELAQ